MGVSKSLRFEVFARDSFTCQYCGRRPPEVVLEVDHIHPQSKGGEDVIINLITACWDCNRGKSAKVISEVAPRPDADLAFLKTQQEIVEVQRFLEARKKLAAVQDELCESLKDVWQEYLTEDTAPTNAVLLPWIEKYGAEEISEAIAAAGKAYLRDQFHGYNKFEKIIKYVGAILRNRKEERVA